MSIVRVREHVNPLSQKYQTAIQPPNWTEIYTHLDRPLHLDIGAGKGRFLLDMATHTLDWNFLGLEIREPLVDQANEWRSEAGLTNLHYLFCNANNSLRPILSSLPAGILQRVTIQFPDPWFKRRHQKRRVVTPDLVNVLAEFLRPTGTLLIQSDIKEVAVEMRDRFKAHPAFMQPCSDWILDNPLPIPTEREISVLERDLPVYRALFIRQ